jgi:hypothetical protein
MASVEPGASTVTWRRVAAIVHGQVHAHTCGRHDRGAPGVKARRCQALPPYLARLEIDRDKLQERRDAEAEVDEALALPGLRTGPIHLEHEQPRGQFRAALGERIQAGSEDDVLLNATASLFRDQILEEAGAGHHGGAEGAREGAHVRTATPAIVRSCRPQADLVFKQVRGRVDFHVQRPPQSDSYCCLVRCWHVLVLAHDFSTGSDRIRRFSCFTRRPDYVTLSLSANYHVAEVKHMGAEGVDRQQQKVQEFMRLLPLTLAVAGLPEVEHGHHLNEGQMEVRANSIRAAYKLARQIILDIAK